MHKKQNQQRLGEKTMQESIIPRSFKIYKGISGKWGALQLDLIPIERSKRDLGAVMITFANPKGDRTYDWDKKIIMALNTSDIAKIFEFVALAKRNETTSIYHDPKAGTAESGEEYKKLSLARGEKHDWFIGVQHKTEAKALNEVRLPIKDGEMTIIVRLLEHALPRILGW